MSSIYNGLEGIVAIQLSIRFWPGQAKLKPQDLGLNPDDIPEIYYLGNKKLYPQEIRQRFGQISNRARTYLYDNSYPFVLDYIRAIPKRNLTKIVTKLEEFRAEFLTEAQIFLKEYDKIREEWKDRYRNIWKHLAPHYPPREYLTKRFDFYWTVFEIKGAEIQETTAPEIEEAYKRAREELQNRYEEMVEEAVMYLRKRVLDVVNNLSTRLREGRIIRNDTLESVRRVEAWFRDLNIFGDTHVEEALSRLKAALDGADYEVLKNNEILKKQVMSLADQVAAIATNLDDLGQVSQNYKRMIDLT